ncbi:MAG: PAS domain S-box protein [Gemmataceae bacterium]
MSDPTPPRANILLVDDRPANLVALEVVLADLGENLVRAGSGEEALQRLAERDFAVVLLDVLMPGLSGFETAQRVRASDRLRHTPIIFLTAADTDGFPLTEAYALGAVDYLIKPIVPAVLRAKVAVFVDLYRKGERVRDLERRERDRAEEGRQASEARYQALVEATSHAVWTWSPAGGGDQRGQQRWWAELTGQPPEEQAANGGAGWLEVVHPDDRAAAAGAWAAAVAAGTAYDAEYRVRARAGGWRHVRARGVPVRAAGGAVREWVGTLDDLTEVRQADEARAGLAAIVASSDDAIVSKSLDGVIRSWNDGAARLFGYTAEEAVGRSITLIIPPDRLAEERAILDRLRRGERVDHFETVRAAKDGRRLHISLTVSPVRDATGRVVGASKVARDVTDRKRAEDARWFLAEAGETLAASLDFETTLAAVARLVVPRLADWCGVYVAEPDGRLRQLAVAPAAGEDAPDVPDGVAAVVHTGEPEFAPGRADGDRSVMTVPLTARGQTLGAIRFVAAGADRRYTPADLDLAREVGRRAGLAVDNARLFRESQEALRLLGVLIEASGRLTGSLLPPAVRAAVLDLSHRLVAADAYAIWRLSPDGAEWAVADSAGLSDAFLRADGRIPAAGHVTPDRPVVAEDVGRAAGLEGRRPAYAAEGIASLLAVPLKTHGRVSGTLAFYYKARRRFDDVTVRVASALADLAGAALATADLYEQEQASRRRAEEADRRKDEFLAMLAHELRNPLAPLRNSLQVLALRGDDPDVVGRVRGMMDRQVTHLVRLVDDLLDVSRITAGKVRLRVERLDLGQILRQAAADHRPAFEAKGVGLEVRTPGLPVWVSGDPTRLAQVFDNLLVNALKFTSPGGRVEAAVAAGPAGRAAVTVRDTGAGIGPVMLPRLFQPFAQADRTLDRSGGGLGLGLAIVRGLVELHGGTVRADSPGLGAGSVFTLDLPALAEPPAVAGGPPRPARGPPTAGAGGRGQPGRGRQPAAAAGGLRVRGGGRVHRAGRGAGGGRVPPAGDPVRHRPAGDGRVRGGRGGPAEPGHRGDPAGRPDRVRPGGGPAAGDRGRVRRPPDQAGRPGRPGVDPRRPGMTARPAAGIGMRWALEVPT